MAQADIRARKAKKRSIEGALGQISFDTPNYTQRRRAVPRFWGERKEKRLLVRDTSWPRKRDGNPKTDPVTSTRQE